MSLSAALNTARSSLQTTAAQIAVSGKNVSGANDPSYSRKIASSVTTPDGAVRLATVSRAADKALYFSMLGATSKASGQTALGEGIDKLSNTIGDPEDENSPTAKLTALATALQQFANQPGDSALGQQVLTQAIGLADTLNTAAQTVFDVRQTADDEMATSVQTINNLLDRFEGLNRSVVQGTFSGADITDLLDKRDAVLSQLSEQIGISVVTRANNDMVIYADGGATLFETTARSVTFEPTSSYGGGTVGNAVFVDGVPVTGENATMPIHEGRLAGLAKLRDDVTVTYESQLDELARGLVEAFAESDQTAGGNPDAAGLFTYSGGPAIPATGTAQAGLAADIRINPAVDPQQGGQIRLLRDGGINGAAYVYNATGAAGFSDRLAALGDALTANRSFDTATGLEGTQSVLGYGASSSGWLEGLRQSVTSDITYQTTLVSRASDALSNATGVNLDDEYALQLQLEQSYAAASKLFGVINDLFDTLLTSFR